MSRHTSFGIGGPADVFLLPRTAAELIEAADFCRETGRPFTLLGDGTNVLVLDGGIRGVVASTKEMRSFGFLEGGRLRALAGARLSALAREAQSRSLAGLEFASGIPGTVGGAVCMNAGAYGGETGGLVESVSVWAGGAVSELSASDMGFGYRSSVLMEQGGCALEVTLRLVPGDGDAILEKMNEMNMRRKESQPLEERSAGSAFRRPPGGYAAEMIDKCGLKGLAVGGAMVSKKHAGFIINAGGATARDVLGLMGLVAEKVRERFGVALAPEIRVLGEGLCGL